jgi:hypothetical protein
MGSRILMAWKPTGPIDNLSDEFHVRVADKLRERGFEATFDFPGYIGIGVGPFYVMIGQHAWDYGTVNLLFPSPNELNGCDSEPFQNCALDASAVISNNCHDVNEIADQWAGLIRLFAAGQRVKRELVA